MTWASWLSTARRQGLSFNENSTATGPDVTRKANVVLTLQYNGSGKTKNGQTQAIATSSARALLDLVSLT